MGKLLPSTDAQLSAEYFLAPGCVETLNNKPDRPFPPVRYFGGYPRRARRIDPNDDMQAADLRRNAKLLGSLPTLSGSAPSGLLSGQKVP